jgi:hypothetical protein
MVRDLNRIWKFTRKAFKCKLEASHNPKVRCDDGVSWELMSEVTLGRCAKIKLVMHGMIRFWVVTCSFSYEGSYEVLNKFFGINFYECKFYFSKRNFMNKNLNFWISVGWFHWISIDFFIALISLNTSLKTIV